MSVTALKEPVLRVKFDQQITFSTRSDLQPVIDSCAAHDRVELDLTAVQKIDSTGLALLRMLQTKCDDSKTGIEILVRTDQRIGELLDLVGVRHTESTMT